jgi:hypothetical protein
MPQAFGQKISQKTLKMVFLSVLGIKTAQTQRQLVWALAGIYGLKGLYRLSQAFRHKLLKVLLFHD